MNPNPHDPAAKDSPSTGLVKEPSRESLSRLIQAFLGSEITAFEFDERLDHFRDSSDPVIRHVVDAIWFHYDDCKDHVVCLSKQQWDYFQRLLLVLASDCRIDTQTNRSWSIKQLIALLSLGSFVYFALRLGWGNHLFLLNIPFGFVSVALSYWRRPTEQKHDPYQSIIFPFATFRDLETAYRSSTFRKTQYPKHLEARSIRSPFMAAFLQLQTYAMWLMLSPFPLLFQALPEIHSQCRIIAA